MTEIQNTVIKKIKAVSEEVWKKSYLKAEKLTELKILTEMWMA